MKVDRGDQQLTLNATVSDEGTIGFVPATLMERHKIQYTFVESISSGVKEAFQGHYI